MSRIGPTLDEARRGIFLDIEGSADDPAVLGTLWVSRPGLEPMFRQHLVDPALRPLAVPPLAAASLAAELRSLLSRAERQHRVLIGWGSRPLEVVRRHRPDLAAAFEAVYRDAKIPAKAWGRSNGVIARTDGRKRRGLSTYAPAAGLSGTRALDAAGTAKAIRGARAGLDGGSGVLSPKRAARWAAMLGSNELDCRAIREVTLRALEDLAAVEAAAAAKGSPKGPKKKKKKRKGH